MSQDVILCQKAIIDAYEQTFPIYVSESNVKKREKILSFISNVTLAFVPPMIVTSQGIGEINRMVFSDSDIRDFVFTLTSNFIVRLAGNENAAYVFDDLVKNLAFSLDIHYTKEDETGKWFNPIDPSYEAIPSVIAENTPSCVEIVRVLSANKYLVTIVALVLYSGVGAFLTKNKVESKAGREQ